jgi:hypothetical protein
MEPAQMEPSHRAYLDIRLSTAPGTLWLNVPLIEAETRLGRPEAGEPGVNLEYLWVGRKHARIFREGTGEEIAYYLENWRGREGIRLYEAVLQPGERHAPTAVVKVSPSATPAVLSDLTIAQGLSLGVPRDRHSATRLSDGRILLVGGQQGIDQSLAEAASLRDTSALNCILASR